MLQISMADWAEKYGTLMLKLDAAQAALRVLYTIPGEPLRGDLVDIHDLIDDAFILMRSMSF